MSRKDNQHYVPRFYLRYFSYKGNQKSIGLYNIPQNKYVPRYASIKNQAYEKHFYDSDGEIEQALQEIESSSSRVLKKIKEEKYLPYMGTEEHGDLLGFVALQSLRTKYAAEASNEMMGGMIQEAFKHDPRIGEDIKKFEIEMRNPAQYTIGYTPMIQIILQDLFFKLLVNKTKEPFITSDHPVVKYNQFLEKRNGIGCITGAGRPGLQIFLPLNHETCLVFYDPWIYEVGDENKRIIEVNRSDDIREINILQMVNAEENLYFDHHVNSIQLEQIKQEGLSKRREEKGNVSEFYPSEEDAGDGFRKKYVPADSPEVDESATESLIVTQYADIRTGLGVSFINETMEAKTSNLSQDEKRFRNKELAELAKDFQEYQMEGAEKE